MKDQIKDNLVEEIRKNIPSGVNITNYLSDTLNIGRESAYRRIRGEINFTFEEVATLSQDLNFSIDSIVGIKQKQNARFNVHMLQGTDYFDVYANKMLEYGRLFREMSEKYETKARFSINTLPYFFHVNYDLLSKFRMYKWLYQNQKVKSGYKFADFVVPSKVVDAHRTFFKDIQEVQNITVIMDDDVFWSVAKDIEYFYRRKLLSDDDLMAIKTELNNLLNSIEQMVTDGFTRNGAKLEIYVSSVTLEASYLHFEYGENQFSQVRIFSISAIDSFDKNLCNIQKEWIDSLKRFSVLVSGSGEIQRFEYMNKQREYFDDILRTK
jgi:hypothetical protein